jgi:hypothetical protein
MIETYYICDRCGRRQNSAEKPRKFFDALLEISGRHDLPNIQKLWCETCVQGFTARLPTSGSDA